MSDDIDLEGGEEDINSEDADTVDIIRVDAGNITSEVDKIEFPGGKKLPIRLLLNSGSKTAKLLGNELEEQNIRGTSRWHSFDFASPVYIESIEIVTSGYPDGHIIKIQTQFFNGNWNKAIDLEVAGNKSTLTVKGLRTGFKFEPNSKYFSDPTIQAVNVVGLEIEDLSETINKVGEIETYRQRLVESGEEVVGQVQKSLEERRAALNLKESLDGEIKTCGVEIERLEEIRKEAEGQITEAQRRVEVLAGREESASTKVERIEEAIEARNIEREQLSQKNAEAVSQLKELEGDINLFPSEIKGYVSQGTKNAKLYASLCIIPFLVLIVLGVRLLYNSEELVKSFNMDNNIDVFEVLLSRIPYVIVSLGFVALVSAVLTFLLTEIVNINRRKQELYKINIIATDVASASSAGLDLSELDILSHKTALKMDMLRDHLKHTLSENYHFKVNPFKNSNNKPPEIESEPIGEPATSNLDEPLVSDDHDVTDNTT